jgi:4-hydroxy-tetrahydrodipicolinate synthase
MLQGPIFALLTPFARDGSVDEGALRAYLGFLAGRGVRAIIANGTTGEFASLGAKEKHTVLRVCREAFAGTIIANVSACAVGDVRALIRAASDSCDAFLLLPPFYYADAPEDGLLRFFEACVHDAPRPVLLYDFPRHTGNALAPGLVARVVSEIGPVVGVKDSSGKLENARAKKDAAPEARVFLGADGLALAALRAGLDGSATGAGNAIPEFLVQLAASWSGGDARKAEAIQAEGDSWGAVRRALGAGEIAMAKAAVACRLPGFPTAVRAPLASPDAELTARVAGELRALLSGGGAIQWKEGAASCP